MNNVDKIPNDNGGSVNGVGSPRHYHWWQWF
jgi:hypothetical protein